MLSVAVRLKLSFFGSSPCYTFWKSRRTFPTSRVLHVSYFGFCLCYNSIQFAFKISFTRNVIGKMPPQQICENAPPKKNRIYYFNFVNVHQQIRFFFQFLWFPGQKVCIYNSREIILIFWPIIIREFETQYLKKSRRYYILKWFFAFWPIFIHDFFFTSIFWTCEQNTY